MNELVHADIFFFVATIAIVVLSVVALVALVYLIIILRNLKDFSKRAKEEGMAMLDDVTSVRHFVKEKSHTLGSLFNLFSLVHRRRRKTKTHSKDSE